MIEAHEIWLGERYAYEDYVRQRAKGEAIDQTVLLAWQKEQTALSNTGTRGMSGGQGSATEALPRLYSRMGDIGVISMRGSMSNSDSIFSSYLGMTTYPAIREAAVFAASDPSVKSVVLDINSGGGEVSGVEGTVGMLRQLSAIKPVYSFTDGSMSSAAYWLGSVGKKIYSTRTGIVGSIGVVAVHIEQTKALADQGIKATVLRAGKYKALGHPLEPLTIDGQSKIQGMLDSTYKVFLEDVAMNLGKSVEAVQKSAEGQEFLGQDALAAGLVTNVGSFEDLLTHIEGAHQKLANSTGFSKPSQQQASNNINIRGQSMSRSVLSKIQAEAAIAAGADPTTIEIVEPTAEALAADAAAAAVVAADALAADEATQAAAAAAVTALDATPAMTAENNLLKAQLGDVNGQLVAEKVKLVTLEAAVKAESEASKALLEIACQSIGKMQIALGGSSATLNSLNATEVVKRHAEVAGDFASKFRVGGVAVGTEAQEAKTTPANVSNLEAARNKAAKIGAK